MWSVRELSFGGRHPTNTLEWTSEWLEKGRKEQEEGRAEGGKERGRREGRLSGVPVFFSTLGPGLIQWCVIQSWWHWLSISWLAFFLPSGVFTKVRWAITWTFFRMLYPGSHNKTLHTGGCSINRLLHASLTPPHLPHRFFLNFVIPICELLHSYKYQGPLTGINSRSLV